MNHADLLRFFMAASVMAGSTNDPNVRAQTSGPGQNSKENPKTKRKTKIAKASRIKNRKKR